MRTSVRVGRESVYDVELVDDLPGAGLSALARRIASRRALLVASPTVASLYAKRLCTSLQAEGLDVSLQVLDCLEPTKTLDRVARICDAFIASGLGRRDVLVGIGGGVCTDLVTLAASLARRGSDYIRIPTTLIGQVDAGIGIKGAVNFSGRKNVLGCFHPPSAVLIDPRFLRTLPERHLRCGLAEVIKIALVGDPDLFELVERHGPRLSTGSQPHPDPVANEVIRRSVWKMLEELEPNFYEDKGSERCVDLGHTFSPGLETKSGFELHHGEAVAIDMALSAELATRLGILDARLRDRILALLLEVGLPIWTPLLSVSECQRSLDEAAIHRGGSSNLVVPAGIGRTTFIRRKTEIAEADLAYALSALRRTAERPPAGSFVPARSAEPGLPPAASSSHARSA